MPAWVCCMRCLPSGKLRSGVCISVWSVASTSSSCGPAPRIVSASVTSNLQDRMHINIKVQTTAWHFLQGSFRGCWSAASCLLDACSLHDV